MVIAKNRNKRRMCVDFSTTINRYTLLDAFPTPDLESLAEEISKYRYFSTFDLKNTYHQVLLKEEDRDFTSF